jgi:hypothetical protein
VRSPRTLARGRGVRRNTRGRACSPLSSESFRLRAMIHQILMYRLAIYQKRIVRVLLRYLSVGASGHYHRIGSCRLWEPRRSCRGDRTGLHCQNRGGLPTMLRIVLQAGTPLPRWWYQDPPPVSEQTSRRVIWASTAHTFSRGSQASVSRGDIKSTVTEHCSQPLASCLTPESLMDVVG